MKTIMIATDFSKAALNAAFYGADMAKAFHANVHLVHIFNASANYSNLPVVMTIKDMEDALMKNLNSLKQQLKTRTNGMVLVTDEMRTGDFVQELKEVSGKLMPFAIIMGSQGTSKLERLVFGSHAVRAMKYLPCPVITVPPERKFSGFKKIALACDLEEVKETLPVQQIKAIIKSLDASLLVINSSKPNVFEPELIPEAKAMYRLLNDCKPIFHLLSNKDPDQAIIEFIENNEVDLLMILPKHQQFSGNITHRSHTRRFVLQSHIPVMSVHPLPMQKV